MIPAKTSALPASRKILLALPPAVYSLIAMQRVFQGASTGTRDLKDFDVREVSTMILMMLGLVYLGVHPQPVFDMVEPTLRSLYELSGSAQNWIGATP